MVSRHDGPSRIARNPGRPGSKRILAVDDSATMIAMVRAELEHEPYEVLAAESGTAALKLMTSIPDIALMLLDVNMPDMSGLDVLERLRSPALEAPLRAMRNLSTRVILVTAADLSTERMRAFELGAVDFVGKNSVRRRLKRLVAQSVTRPLSSELTALVVDDSATIRSIVTSCLAELGVTAYEVEDGSSALAYLKQNPGGVDIVLTDIEMRFMHGDALCRRIRGELGLEELPIVVVSSETGTDNILELFAAGASDYLTKPFIKEEFIARIASHIKRLRLHRLLRNSVEELTALNRMKDQFLAVCSHDLRSPLNSILGFADLLNETESLTEDGREMVVEIKNSGEHLLSVIHQLMELGRGQVDPRRLELSEEVLDSLLESCVASLGSTAIRKGVNLQFQNNAYSAAIAGHQTSLIRVFNNLISNSIKFTQTGGSVAVALENDSRGRVVVTVRDTGIGIPDAMLPRLFEQYTSASRRGTAGEASLGLGLSITKQLVEAHGGQIAVKSKEGAGTAFMVVLPALVTADSGNGRPSESADSDTDLDLPRVLLIEDGIANVRLTRRMLEREGAEVNVVAEEREVLSALQSGGPSYDAVFVNWLLPSLDAAGMVIRIRQWETDHNVPQTPIVALVEERSKELDNQCARAGVTQVLARPLRSAELQRSISLRRAGAE